MILALIAFECRQRLKLLSTYVYAASLFAAGAYIMLASGGMFRSVSVGAGNDRVHANSPYALFETTSTVCLFGLFMIAAVFGQAVYRDFGYETWTLIFTKKIRRHQYLIGRFLGAYVFSALLFLMVGAGQLCGSVVVYFVKPDRLGDTRPLAYAWPYLVQVWPMLFLCGAVFFTLAALTRRMAPVYVAAVVFVLGYLAAGVILDDVDTRTSGALLDPFGLMAFDLIARYWTTVERNRDLMSVLNVLGLNRVLWSVVGAGFLAFTLRRFQTNVDEYAGPSAAREPPSGDVRVPYPQLKASASPYGWLRTLLSTTRLYLQEIAHSGVYWALVLSGLAFLAMAFSLTKQVYGTATLPVTYQVLEMGRSGFQLFALITLTIYAGELAFRERDAGLQDICDATRAPTWVLFGAKLLALWGIALSLVIAIGVAALIAQVARGFFVIDFKQYAVELLVLEWSALALVSVLALTLQVLIAHKYLGHFAMVVYYGSRPILAMLGVEDSLLHYGSAANVRYSDMNGYGDSLVPWLWYRLYWSSFAVLLICVAYVLAARGRERTWHARFEQGRARFGAAWRAAACVAGLSFIGSGTFIYYNTHVLNAYLTAKGREQLRVLYEHRYKSWLQFDQPRVTDVRVRFEITPERRSLAAIGSYTIQNKSARPIARVMILLPDDAQVRRLSVAGATRPVSSDVPLGVRVFALPNDLAPGARATLDFDVLYEPHGFQHGPEQHDVVGNGTFFNNDQLPYIGYRKAIELTRNHDRKHYGLAPQKGMASRDDRHAAQNNYIRQDSDFVSFSAEIGTAPDQLGIAPGYLQRTWLENGRRYASYTMDQPILNFFSVLSARYAVTRDRWRDVTLEIYHHPSHTYNLQRMLRGMKDSLSYCSEAFGPYPHHQARILEFPRYAMFAEAFPNTIPYSEAIGFIARVRDSAPDDVNYPYYVTAHEIAHQWWGHQVAGANVRGATMTSETLAQYSALMVMKRTFRPHSMRRFLKYELDAYLSGRAKEPEHELPLAQNESQAYIHYNKGSLAMYALQDYIGEERVNRALRAFLDAWKFRGPPYATTIDLLGYLREQTPPEYGYLIKDLFETITLYDNRVRHASAQPAPDGGWDVSLEVEARKFRSDKQGAQTELQFADYIDIGALDAAGNAAYLERQKLSAGSSKLHFHMNQRPAKVGIDPLNKLIDRLSDDNVIVPEL